ncbi:hypothetical protein ACFSTH_06730 [Paenibacillus yanchengensis]|uniref:Uncharacterized protein n=1 Tax=Paenibacillus yanchengensis TaxID=2035833 RepID=A0ABW4YIM6_9BACL
MNEEFYLIVGTLNLCMRGKKQFLPNAAATRAEAVVMMHPQR